MIRLIIGGVGGGKSLTATRWITQQKKYRVFGNFDVNLKTFNRLKTEDVLIKDDESLTVNWGFWKKQINKYGGFHIVIDEIHNIMHSRRSASKINVTMSKWVSQIRKVTGANEQCDLVCISQTVSKVDKDIRDLAHEIIHCEKLFTGKKVMTMLKDGGVVEHPEVVIILTYFKGNRVLQRYEQFDVLGKKSYNYRSGFKANNYFRYFDSYELLDFGDEKWL